MKDSYTKSGKLDCLTKTIFFVWLYIFGLKKFVNPMMYWTNFIQIVSIFQLKRHLPSLVTRHRVFSTNQNRDEFSLVIIMDIYSTYISFRPSDRVEEQGYSLVTTQHDHCHCSRMGYSLLDHRIRPLVFLRILTSQFDWTTSRVITLSIQIN